MSNKSKVYLIRKRQQDDENECRLKQQKTTETVAESSSIQTKITDVNDDCLEKVFLNLSFDDLLNIANANTKLVSSAGLVFARKFGKKTFFTSGCNRYESTTSVKISNESITLPSLKHSLHVLRLFGHLISKLIIRFDYKHHHHKDKIIIYASRYGSESLTVIEFEYEYAPRDIFDLFEKPFPKAQIIGFTRCTLRERSAATLNYWFPKMRSLTLRHVLAAPKCMEIHIPQLNRLQIEGAIPTNTSDMFRVNPQITTLILNTIYMARFIRCAHKNLQLLEHLGIRCCVEASTDFGGQIIKFERLKHLEINLDGYLNEEFSKIPFLAEQLEEFTCHLQYMITINNLIDFLEKHPSIIKLNMKHAWTRPNGFKVISSKIAEALPLLQEATFYNNSFDLSAENVLSFTNNCKSLQVFRFNMLKQLEFDRMKDELDEQWELLKIRKQVTLKRKI